MAVLELYDPNAANSTSDGFSSLNRPVLQPSVLRQAYILPTSVQRMAVSVTEKGITSKSILRELCANGDWTFAVILMQLAETEMLYPGIGRCDLP